MIRLAPLALLAAVAATPLAAQTAGEPPATQVPAQDDTSLDKALKDAERDRAQGANSHESRLAMEAFGRCAAQRDPREASRVLAMDFTKPQYRTALRLLATDVEKACATAAFGRGALRGANLLFAGELAEAMLERDATPLTKRLARAAAGPATPAFSFTDRVAVCAVRSAPGDVAALFATARDSAEEHEALRPLANAMALCAKAAEARKPLSISPAGLRAMLATAAYRSVASTKDS